ncbi:MAG: NUDIX hydrolase [Opitutae bacterium]|nr:NUDIX hydrolase [Opitutae bacterium]|tara:strand:- start:558 stop:1124 length:567 start_codon:yes stop_codon:yes gene_type:complete
MSEDKEPAPWDILSDELEADCLIFDVRRLRCRHPDGREDDFFVLDTSDWANVVALTPADELILVRQHRFGSGELSWEVPGGVIDAGEDPIDTAVRELREETGYEGESVIPLASCRPNPAILRNRCHFFLIEGARLTGDISFDPNEELETRLIPLEEAFAWVKDGLIQHALSVDAIFYLWLHRRDADLA